MRAIMVMYDSLNRNLLQPYGCDWTLTPNFQRLAAQSVRFDNCYVGSLPCMPARRELHTGRCNFLHRSWGPLEPFDDSVPEILKNNGIYTHLVSDHQHYWEDGGATYHTRYSSWEGARGQEGDPWKAVLPIRPVPETAFTHSEVPAAWAGPGKYRDAVNRRYTGTESKMPQSVTFANGLEFLRDNHPVDNWFLQIETFDPHEPFFAPDEYKQLYPHNYYGKPADWPPYYPVMEDVMTVQHVRYEYAALLSMCDRNLGKILDFMDQHNMWQDTLLIVNTDHGFLLGEHEWWGKSVMPVYDEIARTPLFVWDPRYAIQGVSRQSLVQTVDLAATLLDFFGQPLPPDMQGRPLRPIIENDRPIREYAVYGFHGGHVNVTDGQYTYMRCPVDNSNSPLMEYTLMPTYMLSRFSPAELKDVVLHPPFSFTKNCPVLRIPALNSYSNPFQYGNKLFEICRDPGQLSEIDDPIVELRMISLIADYLKESDAPAEQFQRLGIAPDRPMTEADLCNQLEKRNKLIDPGICSEYIWTDGAKRQFRAIIMTNPDRTDQLRQIFAEYVNQAADNPVINSDRVLSFIERIVPAEMVDIMRYGLVMIGRSR